LHIVFERINSYQCSYAKYNGRYKKEQPRAVAPAIAPGHAEQPGDIYLSFEINSGIIH
jgi:hypothetical protein